MSDAAEFDAFLKGEGELSRRLQAMAQAEPSAELDNAILNRARLAMAQQAHPQAANDPGQDRPAPRLAQPFGYRWRIPVGIAATLLAGVFANQAFQHQADEAMALRDDVVHPSPILVTPVESKADVAELRVPAAPAMAASTPAKENYSPPPPPPPVPMPAPAPAMPELAASERPQVAAAPAPLAAEPAAAPAPAAAAVPAPAARDVQAQAQAQARGEAMAGLAADMEKRKSVARSARAQAAERVTVTGSRVKPMESKAWLAEIERLLKNGENEQALLEWRGFREIYPREKVAPELEAKLDALEK
jgi:hypothetical protein